MAISKNKPLCQVLSHGKVEDFNREAKRLGVVDLAEADLRGLDLRHANLKSADLRGAYLRSADLRGLDLSDAQLAGASMRQAQVSGTLFPANVAAEEIRLSLEFGTRIRLKG